MPQDVSTNASASVCIQKIYLTEFELLGEKSTSQHHFGTLGFFFPD